MPDYGKAALDIANKIQNKFNAPGLNMVDKNKVTTNVTLDVATGGTSSAADWGTSDYMAVLPGATYAAYSNNALSTSIYYAYYKICYYDENKNFISGYNNGTNYNDLSTIKVVVPSNCRFVRMATASYLSSGALNRRMMFVLGSTLLNYEEYSGTKLSASDVSGIPTRVSQLTDDVGLGSSEWKGKKWVSYGDSITAIGNGNGLTLGWQSYVNTQHKFNNFYGRGIGGQSYVWNNKVWFSNADGTYNSRDDNGDAGNASSYTLPAGTTAHYGAFCSWDRITTMIPASIKDTIDLIFIMGATNDVYNANESQNINFVANNTMDVAWSTSQYYTSFNGDYDLTTLRGAIASTIMKMQIWCPNAIIVIGTPLSGRGTTGQNGTSLNGDEYQKSQVVKEVCNKFSIPAIDVFANSGINPLNRTSYITDTVHPYNDPGKKMLARTVIAGLKNIYPKIS